MNSFMRRLRPNAVLFTASVTLALFGYGCASQHIQSPPVVDVTGVWRGTVMYRAGGTYPAELRLEQRAEAVTGGFISTAASSGPVIGTVSGRSFSFQGTNNAVKAELVVDGDAMRGDGFGPNN